MERKPVDAGHRLETDSGTGPFDTTYAPTGGAEVGRTIGSEFAKGSEAFQAGLKKAAAAVGKGIQERTDEVITYARREPLTALTAALCVGFVIGFVLKTSLRADTGGGTAWLPELNSPRSFLSRWTGSGWRDVLHLK